MTTKRDYYEILDVGANASNEDLKKAYRKQALKYHPDRNRSDDASERFKEVNEAYQVLSDSDRRAAYDRFGHAGVENSMGGQGFSGFEGFGGFGDIFDAFFGGVGDARRGPKAGRDLEYHTAIGFKDAAFGFEQKLEVERIEPCDRCSGARSEPGSEVEKCVTCGGDGEVRRVERTIFGQFTRAATCSTCRGEGRKVITACTECKGRGRVQRHRSVTVSIPPGIGDGNRIRIRGEGEPGEPGAQNGDMYVIVDVESHEYFRRSGDDLLITLEINVAQAALGDTVEIPTLGGAYKLKIPIGTQSGREFRIRNEGIPNVRTGRRGDELVNVVVATPKKLTPRQKELMEQLREELDGSSSTRIGGETGNNWFGRVKDAFVDGD